MIQLFDEKRKKKNVLLENTTMVDENYLSWNQLEFHLIPHL